VSIALYVITLCCFLASRLAFLNSKEKRDRMRHFGLALVLACVLAGTALAGEIPTSGATAPQPPPPGSVVTTGEIHTTCEVLAGETSSTGGDSTTVLAIVLTLISSVR